MKLLKIFCVLIIFTITFSSSVLSEEKAQSINITSERMEVEQGKRLIVFTGKVVAVKENMTILSDKLKIYYDEAGKEIRKMVATGSVRIEQENRTATAKKAEYDRIEEKIVLTEGPEIKECQNVVRGDKITIYLNDGRSVVEGSDSSKVKATLFPAGGKDKGKGCL